MDKPRPTALLVGDDVAQIWAAAPEASPPAPKISTHNLRAAERLLCVSALRATHDNQIVAAQLLGITRHSLKRRIIKHKITQKEILDANGT